MIAADEIGYDYKQNLIAQLFLLEKEQGNPALDKQRPLLFLEELCKCMAFIMEGKIEKLTSKYGLLDVHQSLFVKGSDCNTPIFIIMQDFSPGTLDPFLGSGKGVGQNGIAAGQKFGS